MAITVTELASGGGKGTSSSQTAMVGTTKPQVGDIVLAVIAVDNGGSGGTDPITSTSFSQGGGTGAIAGGLAGGSLYRTSGGSQLDGCVLCYRWGVVTAAFTASEGISFAWATASYAVAYKLYMIRGATSGAIGPQFGTGSGTSPSATTNSTPRAIANGDVVFGVVAVESNTAITAGDSDTTNGSWSTYSNAASGGSGGDASKMSIGVQYKVVTGDGAQTFNPTITSTDYVVLAVGWGPAATGTSAPAGNASGTGTAEAPTTQVAAYGTGNASGTGTAQAPAANPGGAAGVASGTGTAQAPAGRVHANAGNAAATGTANQPGAWVYAYAGCAQGIGSANAATGQAMQGTSAPAGLASGVGTAQAPTAAPATMAAAAAGTGTAQQPSVAAFPVKLAPAGAAMGTALAEWAGAGGTTTVAQDSFTDSDKNLTAHTAETGGSWSSWWQGGSFYGDATWRIESNRLRSGPLEPTWEYSLDYYGIYRLGTGTLGDGTVRGQCIYYAYRRNGIAARLTGTATAYVFTGVGVGGSGALLRLTAGAFTLIADTGGYYTNPKLRLDVSGSSPTALKARIWTGTEPGTWNIDTTDNTAGNQVASGGFGVYGEGYDDDGGIEYTLLDDFLVTQPGGGGATAGATVQVAAMPPQAAGTGTAQAPSGQVRAPAGVAAATGTAQQPSVTTFTGTSAPAGVAQGTGTANQPAAGVGAYAGVAQGTGTANQPTVSLANFTSANAGVASGAATANQPTVTATPMVTANAGVATATGSAWAGTGAVSSFAGIGQGTGTALAATVQLRASAGVATGTGAAQQPAAGPGGVAATATGTGTARQPTASLGAMAATAAGTGTAWQAGVTVSGSTTAYAGVASGTGTANQPAAAVSSFAAAAAGTGTSWAPRPAVAAMPAQASGTGVAWQPSGSIAPMAATATGAAASWNAAVQVLAMAFAPADVATGVATAWPTGIATSSSWGGVGPGGSGYSVTGTGTAATLELTGTAVTGGPAGSATSAAPSGTATNVRPA